MWTIILLAVCVLCGIGWFTRYISNEAMIYYMKKKGYRLPCSDEMAEYTNLVIRNLFL